MYLATQGMEVKKGDTIAFHCEGTSMIPYDELTDFDVDTYACELETPEVGNTYQMTSLTSRHNRQYSLSAVMKPGWCESR